ncbi:MAG: copper amine oxidase N-terminal domain-containing protein [Clostridia bacterium]|nr:copper amine oxidase N-terminal domain-containing protein [Clostridia bacterium]
MKRVLAVVFAFSILLSAAVVFAEEIGVAQTENPTESIVQEDTQLEDFGITVTIDGEELEFDVPPQIIQERTMVPMRAIFEAFGAKVEWMQDAQIIYATYGSCLILMRIDKPILVVQDFAAPEGEAETQYTMDVPPTLVANRTLVPARAVSEALGATVEWDNDTRTVVITK